VPDKPKTREAGAYGGPEAPWTPVPTGQIRAWLAANPDAALETVFPAVYEEDRTSKIKDLATAQGLDYVTHQRAAEQVAKELGIETYDYAAEMQAIKEEKKTLSAVSLAIGDAIAQNVVGLPQPGAGRGGAAGATTFGRSGGVTIGAPAPAMASEGPEDQQPKRHELSGDETARFRKMQREALEAAAGVIAGALREAFAAVRDELRAPPAPVPQAPPPPADVRVGPIEVRVPEVMAETIRDAIRDAFRAARDEAEAAPPRRPRTIVFERGPNGELTQAREVVPEPEAGMRPPSVIVFDRGPDGEMTRAREVEPPAPDSPEGGGA
jgi:hypothetical protein